MPIISPAPFVPAPQAAEQASPGTINGSVVDATGAAVAGARVTLSPEGPAVALHAVSDEHGQFFLPKVAPGQFHLTVSATRFKDAAVSGTVRSAEVLNLPAIVMAPVPASASVQVTATPYEVAEAQIKVQEQQRVLSVFPNFYVSYVPDAVALRPKQKFELALKTLVDPITVLMVAGTAGVQQAQNDYSDYGQGAQGYAKRFGAEYAGTVTDTVIGAAILPSLLKQDPRYYYKGTGSIRSRTFYAIANTVVCKGDNKRWQPNYSAILGGIASGGISNLYYPEQDRGAALVFENAAIGLAYGAVENILQEFLVKKLTPSARKNAPPKP